MDPSWVRPLCAADCVAGGFYSWVEIFNEYSAYRSHHACHTSRFFEYVLTFGGGWKEGLRRVVCVVCGALLGPEAMSLWIVVLTSGLLWT
jgi:hypothetical protein